MLQSNDILNAWASYSTKTEIWYSMRVYVGCNSPRSMPSIVYCIQEKETPTNQWYVCRWKTIYGTCTTNESWWFAKKRMKEVYIQALWTERTKEKNEKGEKRRKEKETKENEYNYRYDRRSKWIYSSNGFVARCKCGDEDVWWGRMMRRRKEKAQQEKEKGAI